MRSRALAERDEKPPWPLPVFHILKIETPLGQILQRIRGILYGFLTMFCCLPKRPTFLRPFPVHMLPVRPMLLLVQWLRLSVVVPPDWKHCLNLLTKRAVRLDASLGSGARCWFRTVRFPAGDNNNGMMFANPGPFKAVAELVRFQRLCDFLSRSEAGKQRLLQLDCSDLIALCRYIETRDLRERQEGINSKFKKPQTSGREPSPVSRTHLACRITKGEEGCVASNVTCRRLLRW